MPNRVWRRRLAAAVVLAAAVFPADAVARDAVREGARVDARPAGGRRLAARLQRRLGGHVARRRRRAPRRRAAGRRPRCRTGSSVSRPPTTTGWRRCRRGRWPARSARRRCSRTQRASVRRGVAPDVNLAAALATKWDAAEGTFTPAQINSDGFALLAGDVLDLPRGVREKVVALIRASQHTDGGWTFIARGNLASPGDVDMTGAALAMLCGEGIGVSDLQVARGLAFLQGKQDAATGGIVAGPFVPRLNAPSNAWALIGLNACGVEDEPGAGGKSISDFLLSLQRANGSFKYVPEDGETSPQDMNATEAAVRALSGAAFFADPPAREGARWRPVTPVAAGTPVPIAVGVDDRAGDVRYCAVTVPAGSALDAVLRAAGCVSDPRSVGGRVTSIGGVAAGPGRAWVASVAGGGLAPAGAQVIGAGDNVSLELRTWALAAGAWNLDLGAQARETIGAPRTVTLTATADGVRPARVRTTGDDFLISADTCTGASLDEGEACSVGVRFAPAADGARAATLLVTDAAGDAITAVELAGTGETAVSAGPGTVGAAGPAGPAGPAGAATQGPAGSNGARRIAGRVRARRQARAAWSRGQRELPRRRQARALRRAVRVRHEAPRARRPRDSSAAVARTRPGGSRACARRASSRAASTPCGSVAPRYAPGSDERHAPVHRRVTGGRASAWARRPAVGGGLRHSRLAGNIVNHPLGPTSGRPCAAGRRREPRVPRRRPARRDRRSPGGGRSCRRPRARRGRAADAVRPRRAHRRSRRQERVGHRAAPLRRHQQRRQPDARSDRDRGDRRRDDDDRPGLRRAVVSRLRRLLPHPLGPGRGGQRQGLVVGHPRQPRLHAGRRLPVPGPVRRRGPVGLRRVQRRVASCGWRHRQTTTVGAPTTVTVTSTASSTSDDDTQRAAPSGRGRRRDRRRRPAGAAEHRAARDRATRPARPSSSSSGPAGSGSRPATRSPASTRSRSRPTASTSACTQPTGAAVTARRRARSRSRRVASPDARRRRPLRPRRPLRRRAHRLTDADAERAGSAPARPSPRRCGSQRRRSWLATAVADASRSAGACSTPARACAPGRSAPARPGARAGRSARAARRRPPPSCDCPPESSGRCSSPSPTSLGRDRDHGDRERARADRRPRQRAAVPRRLVAQARFRGLACDAQ